MGSSNNARDAAARGQLLLDLDLQRQAFAAYNEWASYVRAHGSTKLVETFPQGNRTQTDQVLRGR